MSWARALVLLCALVEAGWMTFDGSRALLVGDFVTPKTGAHAGQIGPWRIVVEAVGLNPRGTAMKAIFLLYGAAWLSVAAMFALGRPWAWGAMVGLATGALWFLPFGTLLSVLQLVVLIARRADLAGDG